MTAKKPAAVKPRADDKKVGAAAPVKPAKVTKPSKNATAVSVLDKNGEVIRQYSQEKHGDSFLDHANEFAGKEEGRKVVEVEE